MEKIIKDKVLICIISQDDVTVTPDAMADFRGVAQDLNHEVIFFSSPKDRHLLKQPI